MANFEPIQFAPLGIKRDSAALGSKLTREDRTQIYHLFKVEFTKPKSPLGMVLVGVNNTDVYTIDLNRRTPTSMVALWLSGAQQEITAATVLLSGVNAANDTSSLQVWAGELSRADMPDMSISELVTRVGKDAPRPVIATSHLFERSYDSVTVNQWSMGLAHAFFDLVVPKG